MKLLRRGDGEQFGHVLGKNNPAPVLLAKPVGHQPPSNAAHPGPETLIAAEDIETLVSNQEGVLGNIIDRFGANAERTHEGTQTRLFAPHLFHEPVCVAPSAHLNPSPLSLYCRHPAGRYAEGT